MIKYRIIHIGKLSCRNAFYSLSFFFLRGGEVVSMYILGARCQESKALPGIYQFHPFQPFCDNQPGQWCLATNLLLLTFLSTAEPCSAKFSLPSNLINRVWWTAWKNAGVGPSLAWVYYYLLWCMYLIVFVISSSLSFLPFGCLVTRLFGIKYNYIILKFSLHS